MADDDATASDGDGGLAGDKKDTPAQKKQVKNEHILIAVGVITLLVTLLYLRKQSSANASGSSTVANSPYGVNSYGASAQDPYGYGSEINTLANDLQSMQSEIAGLTPPGPNSGSTTPSFTPGDFSGLSLFKDPSGAQTAGYGAPTGTAAGQPFFDSSGNQFSQIESWQTLAALEQQGSTIYYEPTPGNFQIATNPGELPAYTPVFLQGKHA